MDLDLFCDSEVIPERPNILTDDLISHFNLLKLYKETKKKKPNRALATSLREIVMIESKLKPPEFMLSVSEKHQLFS